MSPDRTKAGNYGKSCKDLDVASVWLKNGGWNFIDNKGRFLSDQWLKFCLFHDNNRFVYWAKMLILCFKP